MADVTLSEVNINLLILLPIALAIIYIAVILIGNYTILRAGGQTAHENYPKVIEQLKIGLVSISVVFLLFFLVIFGFVPSEVVVVLVSVAVGLFVKSTKN